jgi:hypothetical protein
MMNIAGFGVTFPWGEAEDELAVVVFVEFKSFLNVFPIILSPN